MRRTILFWPMCSALILSTACSRRATREDCDRIITRTAELRAKEQHQDDPAVVEKAIADFKQAHADEIEKECVGRSLGADAMKCVEKAESSDAIEACMY
ncbi:MAG: hypothetical protein U0414_43570 [Polyangiaceae bacterium]